MAASFIRLTQAPRPGTVQPRIWLSTAFISSFGPASEKSGAKSWLTIAGDDEAIQLMESPEEIMKAIEG